jgi:hypothetical protein
VRLALLPSDEISNEAIDYADAQPAKESISSGKWPFSASLLSGSSAALPVSKLLISLIRLSEI